MITSPTAAIRTGATQSVITDSDEVVVELFYADLRGCEPCNRAFSETDEAARLLRDELAALGRQLTVRTVQLQDPGHAQALGIDNPVTVRIAGTEIDPSPSGESAAQCGAVGVAPTTCRSYAWDGQRFDAPPAELIVHAVHRHLDTATRPLRTD